jgi:hypothetical protein
LAAVLTKVIHRAVTSAKFFIFFSPSYEFRCSEKFAAR